MKSAGKRFREALSREKPLQIVGVINSYVAIMAEKTGFHALYISGAGVANSSYGLPDIGITTLDNVLEDVRRVVSVTSLPVLADIDTGWGSNLMIARSIKAMILAGAAGVHIEDQVFHKRCGHLEGKELITKQEMCNRIAAAVEAKTDLDFVIMARTDSYGVESWEKTKERSQSYQEAGADMLFLEACTKIEDFREIKNLLTIPILANLTEFGKALFTLEEMASAGIDMVLYPLSANRAMNRAALNVLQEIRKKGSQKDCLGSMQTRDELYDFLKLKETTHG